MRVENFCGKCFGVISPETKTCPNCGFDNALEISKRASDKTLPLGEVLNDRYLLGRVIGAGGFGITYLAFDMNRQTVCCIKEYFPSEICTRKADGTAIAVSGNQAFSKGVSHFYEEAQILFTLNRCPSVVNVFDFFKEKGTAYLVMEYVYGDSVRQYMKRCGDRLPWPQAKFITLQVALALSEVHSLNIIHSDISPSNILMTPDGDIKLIDFGASKNYLKKIDPSTTVQLKPGFAPPEQYGDTGKLGPWTDIYALACTFYRLATGKSVPSVQARRAGGEVVPITELVAEADKKTSDAIMKALEMDYQDRYPSIDAFITDFSDFDSPSTRDIGIVQNGEPGSDTSREEHTGLIRVATVTSAIKKKLTAGGLFKKVTDALTSGAVRIEVLEGPGKGTVKYLKDCEICRVGRQPDICDLVLEGDSSISRVHCVIIYDRENHTVIIHDKSTNGVSLEDGRRLNGSSAALRSDSIIELSASSAWLKITFPVS